MTIISNNNLTDNQKEKIKNILDSYHSKFYDKSDNTLYPATLYKNPESRQSDKLQDCDIETETSVIMKKDDSDYYYIIFHDNQKIVLFSDIAVEADSLDNLDNRLNNIMDMLNNTTALYKDGVII